MNTLNIYTDFEEGSFLERPNRFVMRLRNAKRKEILAHVPNTGRMEEFCFAGEAFYITPAKNGKYPYRVVATRYQDSYVFLDTIKVNRLFEELLRKNYLPCFQNVSDVRREVRFADSTFDFAFSKAGQKIITEVKSCTLCHNGLAMFPDAPTLRGQRHIKTLERIASEGEYITHLVYLVLNSGAKRFMPNVHTDFEYGKTFLDARRLQFHAFRVDFLDPVTANLQSLREIPIDIESTRTQCRDKGSYLLLLENPEEKVVKVGKLGELQFNKGWYVYVGSAMQALGARIKRHQQKRKKLRWHIDYIASTVMKVKKVFPIRKPEKQESRLAEELNEICDASVPHFGASDVSEDSHLFYFRDTPMKERRFVNILLNARVG